MWGAFPLNDGGLITLDELSGLSEEDLAIMSDVRSAASLKQLGSSLQKLQAELELSTFRTLGMDDNSIQKLTGSMQYLSSWERQKMLDVLTWLCLSHQATLTQHLLTNLSKICRPSHTSIPRTSVTRVLWAWSRRPENIQITDEATQHILDKATEMGARYSSKVPIVEAADQRIKIARLAVATACCVFSADESGENVIVTPEHVDFVVDFMNELYCTKSFGYDRLSEQEHTASDGSVDNLEKLRTSFLAIPLVDANEMAKIIYQLPYFSRATLEDYTGLTKDDLKMLLKFMTTNHLVDKSRGDYRRLPLGTQLFENLTTVPTSKEEIEEARKNYYAPTDY